MNLLWRIARAAGLSLFFLSFARAMEPEVFMTSAPVTLSSSTVTVTVEPYVCPLGVGKCVVVSKWGPREVPGKPGPKEPHLGLCLRVKPGQAVRAARSGKVIFAGFSKEYASRANKKDQSRLIIVQHVDGESTRYVHLNDLRVRPMQEVRAGDILGTAATSDEWSVPVLHFEVRGANGAPRDPAPLIRETMSL